LREPQAAISAATRRGDRQRAAGPEGAGRRQRAGAGADLRL